MSSEKSEEFFSDEMKKLVTRWEKCIRVNGEDSQGINTSSFYNISEAYEIAEHIVELKNTWPDTWDKFNEESICILAPYPDQVACIRFELCKRCLGSISVERISSAQSKQYRVLFISIVRTRRTCNDTDTNPNTDYGFLSDTKLVNTAFSLAQSLVVVVGDPVAMCTVGRCQKVWERFLHICNENNSLHGITWTQLKLQLNGLELKKLYGLNPLAPEFVPQSKKIDVNNNTYRKDFYIWPSIFATTPRYFPPTFPHLPQQPSRYICTVQPLPPKSAPFIPFQTRRPLPPVRPLQPLLPLQSVFHPPPFHPLALRSPSPYVHNQSPLLEKPSRDNSPVESPVTTSQQTSPDCSLIQFLDNVHIPKPKPEKNHSLHDLMNLLPTNMSLSDVLRKSSKFRLQWFRYLSVNKGAEAAKRFNYLMSIVTSKSKSGICISSPEPDDILLSLDLPNLENQLPSFSEYDNLVNQINFDKPVYRLSSRSQDSTDNSDSDSVDSVDLHVSQLYPFELSETSRLYERQSALNIEEQG